MERLQDEVQFFKIIKYRERYRDCAQGKFSRYPLGDEKEVPVQKAPETPADVPAALAGASNVKAGAKVGGTEPGS